VARFPFIKPWLPSPFRNATMLEERSDNGCLTRNGQVDGLNCRTRRNFIGQPRYPLAFSRGRVAIDAGKGVSSRVALSSASEAEGCAFLLISLAESCAPDGVVTTAIERERDRQRRGSERSFKPQPDIRSFPRARIPNPPARTRVPAGISMEAGGMLRQNEPRM